MIGIAAPLVIVAARLLQGFAMMLAAAFGALLGPIGIYIRRFKVESEEFSKSEHVRQPMLELITKQKARLLISTGLIVLATITIWMSVFMPTYAIRQFNADPATAFVGTVITGTAIFILSPPLGLLSDSIGRTTTMIIAVLAAIIFAYPMFVILQSSPTLGTLIAVQAVMGTIIALYFAPLPALMSEIFPAKTRTSGLSLSYNLGVTILGGFAPFILGSLGALTNNPLVPSYYVIFGAIVSGVAIWGVHRLSNAGEL